MLILEALLCVMASDQELTPSEPPKHTGRRPEQIGEGTRPVICLAERKWENEVCMRSDSSR